MDIQDLQKKKGDELVEFVEKKREELRALRFKGAGSGMRDGHAIGNTKKEIAQALTVLNSRTPDSDV